MKPDMQITISTRTDGRVPVKIFNLEGDLDQKAHQVLEDRARQELTAGTRQAILDLTDVRYISSAGLKAIHSIFNFLREGNSTEIDDLVHQGMRTGQYKSRHLKLVNPSPSVLQVLTIAGFDMFMEIHPDLETALKSF